MAMFVYILVFLLHLRRLCSPFYNVPWLPPACMTGILVKDIEDCCQDGECCHYRWTLCDCDSRQLAITHAVDRFYGPHLVCPNYQFGFLQYLCVPSATFIKYNAYSREIWMFQRYQMIIEYEMRPILPPPLIIITHLYLMLKCICNLCKGKRDYFENSLSKYCVHMSVIMFCVDID